MDPEDGDFVALNREEVEKVVEEWKLEIQRLMDWLDWSVWLKCKPACGFGVSYLVFGLLNRRLICGLSL